jgi:hypothetical protein
MEHATDVSGWDVLARVCRLLLALLLSFAVVCFFLVVLTLLGW